VRRCNGREWCENAGVPFQKDRFTMPLHDAASPMTPSFAQIPLDPQHSARRPRNADARRAVIALTLSLRTFVLAAMVAASLVFSLATSTAWAAGKPLPPSPELQAAEAALARAESVDAQQYAAAALLRARSTFSQAQAQWAERRKPEAIALAQLAAAEADFAYARSREAAVESDLKLRRGEISELRAKLEIEAAP
jgi:hypothetical protein